MNDNIIFWKISSRKDTAKEVTQKVLDAYSEQGSTGEYVFSKPDLDAFKAFIVNLFGDSHAADRFGFSDAEIVDLEKFLKDPSAPASSNIGLTEEFIKKATVTIQGLSFSLVVFFATGKALHKMFLGSAHIAFKDDGVKLLFSVSKEFTAMFVMENIRSTMLLDLENDYKTKQYLLFENSPIIAEQIVSYTAVPKPASAPQKTGVAYTPVPPCPLACRDQDCIRVGGSAPCFDPKASEFRRDVITITNSRAFRRTVDKAQIYGAAKGDLFRTRMTHTQVVTQIALSISRRLGLNLDLTEAIALGHDIGHTPFGHQGERTLDAILKGKGYNIIKNCQFFGNKFGFKHNYQSVRVAVTEETFMDHPGMNLSLQTLEGMLKHTKINTSEYDLGDFTDITEADFHIEKPSGEDLEYSPASTLEGQVVALADEIAQRAHDLDDALLSGEFPLDEFKKYMKLNRNTAVRRSFDSTLENLEKLSLNGYRPINETRLIASHITRDFTNYFIDKAITGSTTKIGKHDPKEPITTTLIELTPPAKKFNDYLDKLINSRVVINNHEVARFDGNAEAIVAGLFKAYYDNPRLLRSGTKRAIYNRIRMKTANVIDFETGSSDAVLAEIKMMTRYDLESKKEYTLADIKSIKKAFSLEGMDSFADDKLKNKKDDVPIDMTPSEKEALDGILKEYLEKRRILVRGICDYIAGMTDSYAMSEYERIVLNSAKG